MGILICPEDRKPCTCTGSRFDDGRLICPREGRPAAAGGARRSIWRVVKADPDLKIVWIVDEDGWKSVTNDAERVCADVNRLYHGFRIIYRDTDGNWDELVHLDGHFNNYAEARGLGIVL